MPDMHTVSIPDSVSRGQDISGFRIRTLGSALCAVESKNLMLEVTTHELE